MINLETLDRPADQLPGDSVVVLFFEDVRPLAGPAGLLDWRLNGQLTKMLLDRKVIGLAGEQVVLQNNGKLRADWVLFVGGGKWHGLCRETYAALVKRMLTTADQAGFKDVSLCLSPTLEADAQYLAKQMRENLKKSIQTLGACRLSCND
ncbi:MAG: hypothetical protein JRE16_09170 [Deltaproteobacteria bacterium]|jgi:hypothetical protein|nr:hypothetical protein [Deltaproteobacteria bacterium]MBW2520928.1 hypothetical protein [Deltaproteobacteria bacterium]